MATLDQIAARRRKDLIAAEIEARRKAAEYTMGLLAGFDPSGGAATQSVMGPDPTFSGVPGQSEFLRGAPIDSQVTPGDKETILDRRRKRDLWSQVPDMRTEEFDPSAMPPIPARNRLILRICFRCESRHLCAVGNALHRYISPNTISFVKLKLS